MHWIEAETFTCCIFSYLFHCLLSANTCSTMSGYPRYPNHPAAEHSLASSNISHNSVPKSQHDLPPHEHNNAQFQPNQSKKKIPLGATTTPELVEVISSFSRPPIDYPAEQFVSSNLSHPSVHKPHPELPPHEQNNAQFLSHQNKNNFPIGNTSTPDQESFHAHRIPNSQYYASTIDHPTTIDAHPISSAPPAGNPNYLNVELSSPPYPPRKHNANHDKPSANRYVPNSFL